jgi:putative methyltransferase (TIGR04325 family)
LYLAKKLVNLIVPPIFTRLWKELFKIGKLKEYADYATAAKECTQFAYESKELVDVIVDKTKTYIDKLDQGAFHLSPTNSYTLSSIFWILSQSKAQEITVLDFGGACGLHYFEIRKLIGSHIKINWAVVETPTMAETSMPFKNNELSFFADIESAKSFLGRVDLLHISGTLQYTDTPRDYFSKLLETAPAYIVLNRLCLNKVDKDIVWIQSSMFHENGEGPLPEKYVNKRVDYPFTLISEKFIFNQIEKNYKILLHFRDETGLHTTARESKKAVAYGLFLKRS